MGNVRVVVGDRKHLNTGTDELSADVIAYNNYYPFGMPQPGRNFDSQEYRYGFNGMERDDEVKGSGNSYDFGARIYDSRIGRFLSIDPLVNQLPSYSPYVFAGNSPISHIDANGENPILVIWASQSDDGSGILRIGHAGIVVEQFTKTTRLVNPPSGTSGPPQLITEYVSTGWTYYDLWPGGSGANMTDPTTDVPAAYNETPLSFSTKADLINYLKTNDITGIEGYAPDGVVEIELTPQLETQLNDNLKTAISANADYNAESNNCSGFVCDGLNSIGFDIDKEWSLFFVAGVLQGNGYYHKFHTPNNTYNTVVEQDKYKTTIHKDAGGKTSEDYEDAVVDPSIKQTIKN